MDRKLYAWKDLNINPSVLVAPRTGGAAGIWPAVHPRIIQYLGRQVQGHPWADHLALIAAVYAAQSRDVWTTLYIVKALHPRFLSFADVLPTMQMWNVDRLVDYVRGGAPLHDSPMMRFTFYRRYQAATKLVAAWFASLTEAEQEIYHRFLLPSIPPLIAEELSQQDSILLLKQTEAIEMQTDVLLPEIGKLRAEAHHRYNRVKRLWQAYQTAVKTQVSFDHFPINFRYTEGEQQVCCRLWDRRSFVLDHSEQYAQGTVKAARLGLAGFGLYNEVFLEVDQDQETEFWFAEILTRGVFGSRADRGTQEEIAQKQSWLRQWGYGGDNDEEMLQPFKALHKGLLSWPSDSEGGRGSGRFMTEAMERTGAFLIPIESIYAGVSFGLLALELLTTTGLRMREMLLLPFFSDESLIRLVDDISVADNTPHIQYLLRITQVETPRHHIGLGMDSLQILKETVQLLLEHYHLQPGDSLPHLPFAVHHEARHRFGDQPYLFQYAHAHMDDQAINACLRFLLHGLMIQTREGVPVIVQSQLLRHAFDFPIQQKVLPIDIVSEWLNVQKSKPISQGGADPVLNCGIREIYLREAMENNSSPELRQFVEQARRRVGTLVPVLGGICTFDGYCPNAFRCIGCAFKVPEPKKRSQVEEKLQKAQECLVSYEQEGLVLEVEKIKNLIQACAKELEEMGWMEEYRKDASKEAIISLE